MLTDLSHSSLLLTEALKFSTLFIESRLSALTSSSEEILFVMALITDVATLGLYVNEALEAHGYCWC